MEAADRIRDKLQVVSQKMRGSGTTFVDARDLLTAIDLGLELYGLLTRLEHQMNAFVEKTHAEGSNSRSTRAPRSSPKIDKSNTIDADSGHRNSEGKDN